MKYILNILVIGIVVLVGYLLIDQPFYADPTKPFQHQIDSLKLESDSLHNANDIIYDSIHILNGEAEMYNDEIIKLNKQLKYERHKTQEMVDLVDAWNDNDLIWFLTNRYQSGLINDSTTKADNKISRQRSN